MTKRPTFKDFKKEMLKDPEIKAEYEALRPEFELLRGFIKARIDAKLSQEQLAEKLELQQPAIARLEGGGYTKTSVKRLNEFATALGCSLKISLEANKIPLQAKRRR